MPRPRKRAERRVDVTRAFARVLAAHGQGGATVARVAAEAGVAPGLIHHHFRDKQDLFDALLGELVANLRRRVEASTSPGRDPLDAYIDAALALGERSDVASARAWVGVLAAALGDRALFVKVRRVLEAETAQVARHARGSLSPHDASAVVAFVVGALVVGAFAPQETAGFAAPSLRRFVAALRAR